MDKGNLRQPSEFLQRQAARWLGAARLPPEGLTPWQAAEILAEGDTAGNRRWLGLLADAINRGELAVTTVTHTPPDVPWWRQNRPMEKTLRAPKPQPKTIRRIAYADLARWLAFIGAPAPDWLPAPTADKAAAGLARHGLTAPQERDCKAALRALCKAEHAAGRVLSVATLRERCPVGGRPAPEEWAQPIAREFWPDGAPRGRKKRP